MSPVYVQQVAIGTLIFEIGGWVCVTVGVSGTTESSDSLIELINSPTRRSYKVKIQAMRCSGKVLEVNNGK
ncbi:hypothetical protein TNCV_3226641 [Trichonephila clavipes]|nr:hypothetical protein TNCV_3226641 [Trichonephila clavipes]